MLEYLLNNEPLWIDEGTSVVVKNYNPACFFDSLQNCQAEGVDIPANERNRAILENPERFERDLETSTRKYENFEIRYKGARLLKGYLVIDDAGSDGYSGWVQSDLGALGEAQQETYINEMDWPTNVNFPAQSSFDDNNDDFGIKLIHNRLWWDGKGKEKQTEVEYRDASGVLQTKTETRNVLVQKMWENYGSYVNSYDLTDIKEGCVISPFLHLRYVIRESLRLNNFFIDRNDMINGPGLYSLSFLKNIMVYNNFNIVDLNTTTQQEELLWWYPPEQRERMIETNVIDTKTWFVNSFNYADLLPRKTYKEFLVGLQNSLNYIFHFRYDGFVNIIDRNAILNQTPIDLDDFMRGDWKIGERKDVRLKFTPEYDEDDANYADEFEDLSDRWQDFGNPVDTEADLDNIVSPAFGELRLVEETNQIFEYGFHVFTSEDPNRLEDQFDTLGWKFVSNGPQPYIHGDVKEEEEIKTAISTLQQNTFELYGSTPFYSYNAVQKGNMNKMRSLWNDYTLRLITNNAIFGYKALYWEGEFGLFNQRWKTWADFWKTRLPVEANFQLPVNMFTHLQNNITDPFRTKKGNFIIQETETEFGMHQVGPTKITGFKF